ncbi:hypothetical protein PFZ79_002283 [Enterococcus hirae]|nr:hypothetical protein [Enterococcus hirae]
MPNQKTWTGKVGDTKTFTISAVPVDAGDAAAVIAATTAISSDDAIATIVKNENGGFDGSIIAEGTAAFEFTSGAFTTSIAVTGTPAS